MLVQQIWFRGPDFDVDRFCTDYRLEPDASWHRGERGLRDRVVPDSGFRIDLASSERWPESWAGATAALRTLAPVIRAARMAGAEVALSIGFTIGVDPHFTRTARFSADDLKMLAELGIGVEISAYPGTFPDRGRAS